MGIHDREYYRDEEMGYRLTRPQSVVVILIIINVAIFIVDSFVSETVEIDVGNEANVSENQKIAVRIHPISEFMAIRADLWQKPWLFYQLMTNGFAHAPASETFWHVGGNMLVLFFLGRPVEMRYGSGEFLRFYLTAIVLASLIWLLSQIVAGRTESAAYGASGAVTATVMLFIFNFPHQTLLIWGIIPIRAWILGVIMIGLDLMRAFNPDSMIAWEAHLGGAAFAAAYFYCNWNLKWMDSQVVRNWFSAIKSSGQRRRLKIHQPPVEDNKLLAEADRILKKISEEGEESLTNKERKTLEKYSRLMRKKNS